MARSRAGHGLEAKLEDKDLPTQQLDQQLCKHCQNLHVEFGLGQRARQRVGAHIHLELLVSVPHTRLLSQGGNAMVSADWLPFCEAALSMKVGCPSAWKLL